MLCLPYTVGFLLPWDILAITYQTVPNRGILVIAVALPWVVDRFATVGTSVRTDQSVCFWSTLC